MGVANNPGTTGSGRWPDDAFVPTPHKLVETVRAQGSLTAYRVLGENGWQDTDWNTYLSQIKQAARALIALGVQRHETICILGYNRPEWTIMAHAAMMAGAAPAGIYFTSSGEEIEYIVNHSETPVLLVETNAHFQRIEPHLASMKKLRKVVMMRGGSAGHAMQMTWDAFNVLGGEAHSDNPGEREIDARLRLVGPKDPAMRIYTSGTTGPPKAVVLSHGAISWTGWTLKSMFATGPQDRMLSYLPLAHIAEASNSIHNHVGGGYQLAFAKSMETLGDHLKDIRPTVFFGVPRVWQKIHDALNARLAAATGNKAKLAGWAINVGREHSQRVLDGEPISLGLKLKHRLADALVLKKIRQAIGLDQCRVPVSGAAPISRQVLDFFAALGIVIYEVYGQSEDCGPTTFNTPDPVKLGTVGRPIPGLELKIAGDDEILVRAPSLFDGYAKDEAATAAALQDGWMHTGDLGRVDNQGFVTIIGRKKDILITSGGKNITPANLEQALADLPLVEHAVVCGEGRHFLTALLTLNSDDLAAFASEKGIDPREVRESGELHAFLETAIDAMNTKFARVEQIRKFVIAPEPFSLEGGELTPTLKVKRAFVTSKYASLIDPLYQSEAKV